MKDQRRGRIIFFALLVLFSTLALAFAWVTYLDMPTALRSLPATYKLNAAELDSLVRVVRSDYELRSGNASRGSFVPG
jgi:hypothetical protein